MDYLSLMLFHEKKYFMSILSNRILLTEYCFGEPLGAIPFLEWVSVVDLAEYAFAFDTKFLLPPFDDIAANSKFLVRAFSKISTSCLLACWNYLSTRLFFRSKINVYAKFCLKFKKLYPKM